MKPLKKIKKTNVLTTEKLGKVKGGQTKKSSDYIVIEDNVLL